MQTRHDQLSRVRREVAGLVVLLSLARPAVAAEEIDIEIPVLVLGEEGEVEEVDATLDLANLVQSAAKGITTVQEAPAVVTVITSEEIEEQNFPTLQHAADAIPGYLRIGALHNQFPFPATRGVIQSTLYMHNGISMFDPAVNVPAINRVMPLETIKRVEMVTGPGGVLWGANSYLGIINVITKDADDVDGVEAAVTVGHGNGDREMLRGYVMAGIPELFSDHARLFIHTSFDTFIAPGYEMPLHMFSQPVPNPNSLVIYGPLTQANPPRSFIFNFDGKLGIGPVNIYFSAPLVENQLSLGFPGFISNTHRAEDDLVICSDGSVAPPGRCPAGTTEQGLRCPVPGPGDALFDEVCLDPDRRSRINRADFFDRYIIAEYQTRLADGKAGLTVKGYFNQFVRDFKHLGILAPVGGLLEGGISFSENGTTYRTGVLVDGDLELPSEVRLLYGAEGFHEWYPDNTTGSRQGAGIESRFIGPYDLGRLPFGCPVGRVFDAEGNPTGGTDFIPECPLTFAFETTRSVLGAYVNPQWRPSKKLIIDGGARLQIAPDALGSIGYPLQQLFSGALVYGFMPDWHVKVNYAQGFRPPVFNNVNGNGDGVQIGGNADIKVEYSQAYQAEVNARVYKGKRQLREVSFRADYSYTQLENVIQIVGGSYTNSGERAMHSAEFLGKAYLRGGHHIQLGYTWLTMAMSDRGLHRSLPEHWFNLSGFFRLGEKVSASGNLRVIGAMEDPNRMVEYRNYAYDEYGKVISVPSGVRQQNLVQPHEMVIDRIPPVADLTLGVTYRHTEKLALSAYAYNALNARYFQPDPFSDYEPRLEFTPNPNEDFYFRVNATYNY